MNKRSKSLPSVLLACALLSTMPFATVVQAADTTTTATATISKDDAVKQAREVANLPEAAWKVASVDQRSGTDVYDSIGRPTWVIQFSSTQTNTYAGASVVIDSTNGQLLSLSRYDKGQPPKTGTLNRDDAKKLAEAFLTKNAPNEFKQSEYNASIPSVRGPYDGNYNFTYERQANGVFVLGDQLTISISPDGVIQNYLLHWTDAQFPAADGTIDTATANKAYADSLKLQLSYQEFFQNTPTAKLLYKSAYAPYNPPQKYYDPSPISYPIIDAKSGKLLDLSGKEATNVNAPNSAPLVKDGPTEPKPLTTPLTQEQAEQLVKSYGLLPDNVTLVSSSYNENGNYKVWNLAYQSPDATPQNPAGHYNISINATTGELNNFNGYLARASNDPTPHFTNDELKAKAIELVKTLFKDRTGGLLEPASLPTDNGDPNYTLRDFNFIVLKNGVRTNQSVNVSLDAVTGNVQYIMGMMPMPDNSNITYPTPDNLIAMDKAKDVFLQNRPLRLSYMFPVAADGTRAKTAVLVYTPYPSWTGASGVDAKTGEWYNADMGSQQKPPVMPTDIKGHWAEKVLTRYAELGLLELVDGKANPDQKLTRAQVVRLLVDSRSYGGYYGDSDPTFSDVPKDFKYYGQIETAVREGWIAKDQKFRPNDTITREEVAAILARVEGYKDLSTHKEIFSVSYADRNSISDWAYGSVAINFGLGVMRGADNKFDPRADITLAQMVTILDKLSKLPTGTMFYK